MIAHLRHFAPAFVSALAIIGSTIIMPANALADAGTNTEPPIENPTSTACEYDCTDTPATSTEQVAESTDPPQEEVVHLSEPDTIEAPVTDATLDATLESDIDIANNNEQAATSGDATIVGNDDMGNVGTGQADGTVFIENQANTITNIGGGQTTTIAGTPDQTGGIIVTPQASAGGSQSALPVELTDALTVDNDTSIANIVVVDSQSGTANILGNEDVGNIDTGDAVSDVAILNMANHIIAAGDVFVGSITINGDLNNDIILSEALIAYLLQGTAPASTIGSSQVSIGNLQVIENDVEALAQSGAIVLTENEETGDARTGNAQTLVLIKNMAGSFVLYGKSLLVIVNVLGDWNGGILGQSGSVATLTPSQDGLTPMLASSATPSSASSTLDITNRTAISNKVTATARSGDINASYNENIGNTTTGDATAKVKIMNVANTIVSFGSWLGVLFITVFGNWNGGVVMQQATPTDTGGGEVTPTDTTPPPANPILAPFTGLQQLFRAFRSATSTPAATTAEAETVVAGADTATPTIVTSDDTPSPNSSKSFAWVILILLITGGMLSGDRIFALRNGTSL